MSCSWMGIRFFPRISARRNSPTWRSLCFFVSRPALPFEAWLPLEFGDRPKALKRPPSLLWCCRVSSCWRPVSWYFRLPCHRTHGCFERNPCRVWRYPIRLRWSLRLIACRRCRRLSKGRITCEDEEIVLLTYHHWLDLRSADDGTGVTSELCKLGLYVSEGAGDWESAGEGAMWSQDEAVFFTLVEDLEVRVCVSYLGSILCLSYW